MMLHTKRKRTREDSCVSQNETQHTSAFRPNGLNAVIKAAFREGCVYPRRERVMIIDGI